MNRLKNKVCVITGAALGIGRAAATLMANEGASVVVADVNLEGAERVAVDIQAAGGTAIALPVDALQDDSVKAMIDAAYAHYGRIDVLYNNVGFTDSGLDTTVTGMDWSYWETSLRLNLGSTVFATRCALPYMLESGGGSVINTASMAAVQGMTAPTAYASAKSGVIAFSRSVAVQYGAQGIRCNTIAPGLIMTTRAPNWPKPMLEVFRKHILVPRFGEPEDIGNLAVFLASDESGYVTGQLFQVDGGAGIVNPVTADLQALSRA